MLNAKPPPRIFTNAITNEVFDAVLEARTKNRDVLLVTYHGNIHESCSEFFSYISALRDSVHDVAPRATEKFDIESRPSTSTDDSSVVSYTGSDNRRLKDSDSDLLFRCRARDIIQSTTFIFIGRSNRKELLQFQKDMLNLTPKCLEEKNIITEALSFLSLFPAPPKNNSNEVNENSWFGLVKDSNSLICHRMGATMPPSWWGEDPSIIPTVFLVSANGTLNPIYVGKTNSRRNDGFAFGLGRRAQSGMFPSHIILGNLIEERIKRAQRVYKWLYHSKQEFAMIESKLYFLLRFLIFICSHHTNLLFYPFHANVIDIDLLEKATEDQSIFSFAIPADILSHIFEFLDHTTDISNMELVSKSALRVTQEIMIFRLRSLLNEIETILPDSMDEEISSEIDDDERVSAFTKKVRSLINTSSAPTPQTSLYPLSYRTTSTDSMKTSSSFSSSCLSDISECIDDLDRNSLSYSSLLEGNIQGADLWMGWRCHMLTSVCMANCILNRFQFLMNRRCQDSSRELDDRLRNLYTCRQKMFAML